MGERIFAIDADPAVGLATALGIQAEAESITQAIDHILKTGIMDCGACSLQKVCDEVEELRELHFGK